MADRDPNDLLQQDPNDLLQQDSMDLLGGSPSKTPSNYAPTGQLVGGLAGTAVGSMVGHPYIGGVVGGTTGRAVGSLEGKIKEKVTPNFAQQHPIKTALMLQPISPAVRYASVVASLNPEEQQKFTKELFGTTVSEGGTALLGLGVLRGLGAIRKIGEVAERMPHNAVLKLRDKLVEHFKNINTEYGTKLNGILDKAKSKIGESLDIPVDNLKNSIQKHLSDHGIIDFNGKYVGNTPIQEALYNLYEGMGKVKTMTWDELRNIEKQITGKISKPTVGGQRALNETEHILTGVKHDIAQSYEDAGIEGLTNLRRGYAEKRTIFNAANKAFKPFASEYNTKQGVANISRYLDDAGTRTLIDDLSKELGYNISKQALTMSTLKKAGQAHLIEALIGAGVGQGIGGHPYKGALAGAGAGAFTGFGGSAIGRFVQGATELAEPVVKPALPYGVSLLSNAFDAQDNE